MPKLPKISVSKKRSKRPKCIKPTSFPCGFSCQPQYRKGKEVECGKAVQGQAKTFLEWGKKTAEALELTNKKRARVGLTPAKIDKSGYITAKREKLEQTKSSLVNPQEKSKAKLQNELKQVEKQLRKIDQSIADIEKEWNAVNGNKLSEADQKGADGYKGYTKINQGDTGYSPTSDGYKLFQVTSIDKELGFGGSIKKGFVPNGTITIEPINGGDKKRTRIEKLLSPDTPSSVIKELDGLKQERKKVSALFGDVEDELIASDRQSK